MNKKKVFTILLILIVIGLIVYFISNHISITKTNDPYLNYTPEEELSDSQTNQTSILLYFVDKETNQIKSESRFISASELLKNPYKTIVENLINGPSSENLKSAFPENTRLIDASLTNNCVILNFSDDILNFKDDTEKFNIINSILNSLSQLTEVSSIKFLINNEPRDGIDQEFSVISENT